VVNNKMNGVRGTLYGWSSEPPQPRPAAVPPAGGHRIDGGPGLGSEAGGSGCPWVWGSRSVSPPCQAGRGCSCATASAATLAWRQAIRPR